MSQRGLFVNDIARVISYVPDLIWNFTLHKLIERNRNTAAIFTIDTFSIDSEAHEPRES